MNVEVGNYLLNLVYRHSIRSCIPALLIFSYIGYFLWLYTSGHAWIYWLVIGGVFQITRPVTLKWLLGLTALSVKSRLILAGISTLIYGASIGTSVLFFSELELTQRLVITLVLVGSSAAAGCINAGYTPFYLCFTAPIMIPLVAVWLLDPGDHVSTSFALSLTGLAAVMIQFVTVIGNHNFNTFSDFVQLTNKQMLMSAELTDALERAEIEQEHAVSSNLSKTRFIAAASHDLRQPVHIISLFGAALESMVEQDKAKAVVGDMNKAVRSLSKQVNELLDIAKLDSNYLKPDIKQLELNVVVRLIVDELKTEAVARGIDLINAVDKGLYVYSDRTMLSQILRNVIGNAIKYTHEGSVVLSTQNDGSSIVLSVVDTGIGMSEDEQKNIFEEFFQIDNPERSRDKGVGLGLAIVDRLIRSLSHEISVDSSLGKGTCVSLHLKACEPQKLDKTDSPADTVVATKNATSNGEKSDLT